MNFCSPKSRRNLSCFFICTALSIIIWIMFHDLNWIFNDDELFVRTTAIGHPSHSWTGSGRFWPLGLCDYSILLALPCELTVHVHFVYNAIMMIASVFLMFNILNKITRNSYFISLFAVFTLLMSSSFIQIHMSCIYPERCMFFMQVLFMYFWYKAKDTNNGIYYFLSFIFASYVIFSKEPVFGMIATIALTHLIFNRKQIDFKEKIFNYSLLFSSMTYLLIYIYRWFFRDNHSTTGLYANMGTVFAANVDILNIAKTMCIENPLLPLILILCAIRAYHVLIKSDLKTIWTDALLFGATAYSIAYFLLAFPSGYYHFPAIVFSLPSFAYWIDYFSVRKKTVSFIMILCTIIAMAFSMKKSIDYISYNFNARKKDMQTIEFIVNQYLNGIPVFMYTNGIDINKFRHDLIAGTDMSFTMYRHFINYALCQKKSPNRNIVIPIENTDNLPEHCILICHGNVTATKKQQFKDEKFKLVYSNFIYDETRGMETYMR